MTKLGKHIENSKRAGIPASALAADDPMRAAAAATKLSATMGKVARGDWAELPVFGRVWIQLNRHTASNSIEAATIKEMERVGIPLTAGFAGSAAPERNARILADGVRDPDDPTHETRFGTEEQWLALDDDLIQSCALYYDDVRARLDPLGNPYLSDDGRREAFAACTEAFKKKDRITLLSFGVAVLSAWLLSGEVQLSTSPTPSSTSSPSSQGSSSREGEDATLGDAAAEE